MPSLVRTFARTAVVLTVALAPAACADVLGPGDRSAEPVELPRPLTAEEAQVVTSSNAFALDLTQQVLQREEGPNVVVSPLSVSMALGMLMNGATGTTLDGMRTALSFDGLPLERINASYAGLIDLLLDLDPSVELALANSAWANETYPFEQAFFDSLSTHFGAEARSVPFDAATKDAINAWADEHTSGRIDRILDEIDPRQALLLLNAVFFDAEWTERFDPDETRPRDFRREDGTTVTVPMMKRTEVEAPWLSTQRLSAVELPYGGQAFAMLLVVPRGETTLRELVATMDPAEWQDLTSGLQEQELSSVSLPKFTLSYDVVLNDPLSALGMAEAFRSDADFQNLSPVPMCVDFVRQKTFLEVDEAGTTAAAVTAVGMGPTSLPPEFVADRPFLLVLRERLTGTVLFTGAIGDPTASDAPVAEMPAPCRTR